MLPRGVLPKIEPSKTLLVTVEEPGIQKKMELSCIKHCSGDIFIVRISNILV